MRISSEQLPLTKMQTEDGSIISYEGRLSSYGKRVDLGASETDYRLAVMMCCDEMASIFHALDSRKYQLWIFLAGARLTDDQRERLNQYDLFSVAQKWGLSYSRSQELDIKIGGSLQAIGLYELKDIQIEAACAFSSYYKNSLIAFLPRNFIATRLILQDIHKSAFVDKGNVLRSDLNWTSASEILCKMEAVILKTFGAYDDNFRSVSFVFSPKSSISSLFLKI